MIRCAMLLNGFYSNLLIRAFVTRWDNLFKIRPSPRIPIDVNNKRKEGKIKEPSIFQVRNVRERRIKIERIDR